VIGAACAHYLAGAGWSVTVIDRGDFGWGCSHANCGFVSPSHVLPLAVPGAVRTALASLFRPDSPFRVKPRFDPGLWAWLFRFARRCNTRDMMEAGHAIQALLNSSRRLYDELLQDGAIECEWEPGGLLFVLQSHREMEHSDHTARLLRESFGLDPVRYDGEELTRLEPALKDGLAGGWLHKTDAHLRPDRLMASWQRTLEARGVTVRTCCEMRGFHAEHGAARAVVTSQGELPADAFVVATGAWTPLLARHLGCRVPIQPGKGYSITMPRPAVCPRYPLILEEHRVAVTPMRSGYRLGSTMEFAGYDASINPRRLDLLRRGAAHYLREPYGDVVEEEWFGWRPMTWDSKPVIDRSPALSNVWVAAGHNMLGLSMAPATGKLVAELLGKQPCHIDPAPYSVARF
jgi:D-amino-acid dehydrogenase